MGTAITERNGATDVFGEIDLPALGKCCGCSIDLGGNDPGRALVLCKSAEDGIADGDIVICKACGCEHIYRGGALAPASHDDVAKAFETGGGDPNSMVAIRLILKSAIERREWLLTDEAVSELEYYCLRDSAESPCDEIVVKGLVHIWHFARQRVSESRAKIVTLLSELPEEFRVGSGGGLSLRRGQFDRAGNKWAQCTCPVESLVCLGIAAEQARWLGDREAWHALPGGVPYVSIF